MTPYAAVDAIGRDTFIPSGPGDACSGYGVVGLPFRSGHVLALLLRASSLGQACMSLWHRDPVNRWTFYSTVAPDRSCARYFGAQVHRNVVTPIDLEWTTPWALRVQIGAELTWQVSLQSSPMSRLFNTFVPLIPARVWRLPAMRRGVGLGADAAFGTGRVNLTGRTPNGHRFIMNPRHLWLVAASTAHVSGQNVGPPGPLEEQAALEDLRLPQRGLLAVASVRLERRPSEKATATRYGTPCNPRPIETSLRTSPPSRRPWLPLLVAALGMALPASAQSPLSLADAIARAKARNPDATAAAAAEREAAERVTQARSGLFPQVDVAESWQRGSHPVFVFSSLLAQRRFTTADFALDALNHPGATNNFRTAVSVEQALFDRATSAHVRAASIARDMSATGRHVVDQDLTSAVTDAFGRVLIAAATVRSVAASVESARTDRELAGNRRDAGRVTDADVLQLDVSLARTLERQVQATSDERVARARLNQLMGEPLNTMFSLDLTPPAIAIDIGNPAALEEEALKNRPDVSLARQQEQLAAVVVDAARAAFLPQVSAQGTWELNGATWSSRSPSWVAGAVARINLFHGRADKARLAEAHEQATRRAIERSKAETMARLDVQIAIARLEAARASEAVGRAAADQARESRRIIRDRYESGLTDAALLLRAADAVQQADAQQIAARVGVLTATATLQRAMGKP